MKKNLIALLLAVAGTCALTACGGQNDRMDELKSLIEDIKEEGGTYTEEQWKAANEKFSKLLEQLGNDGELSAEELNELARLQGEYAATVFEKTHKDVATSIEKAKAFFQGLQDGLNGETDADGEPNDSTTEAEN